MFGGQNNTAAVPQSDDALKGVTDLVGGTAIPVSTPNADSGTNNGLTSTPSNLAPSDSSIGSVPALSDDAAQNGNSAALASIPASAKDELFDIKKQALQQLTPLVNHLDQTPLERFRTLMMLIQASDNQTLLKEAYDAAQKIEDDKVRAQALLDVVNEINYFTQSKE